MSVAVISRLLFVFWAGLLISATDIVTHGHNNSSQCPEFCAAGVTSEFICHPIDGTCLHGCQPGYRGAKCDKYCIRGAFGKDCSSGCPQHCMKFLITEPVCHHISAVCLQGCMPGLRGVHCDEPCDPGTYGNDCSLPCPHHCEMFDPTRPVCHRVSGACTQGCLHGFQGIRCEEKCANGFHGQDCTQDCPQHCEDIDRSQSACGPISGICLQGCKPGHKGIVCDEICDRETYGRDCSFTCPQHCGDTDINRSVCHHVTGACVQGCQPGYGGIRCSEKCSRRMFGHDCSYDCPQQCASFNRSQSICDHVSGFCTQGCKPGYKGILCDEECGRGTYGQDCNSTCPHYCQNVDINRPVCHHTSGACTQGCQPGYTGLLCDKPCPNGWFGWRCEYKCRCTENKCEQTKGTCYDGATCQPEWFGPACQYVDLAQRYKASDPRLPVNLILDGNENTCLNANEVTLSLLEPCQLTWFRAHVRDSYVPGTLKIQFREKTNSPLLACENQRTAQVSETAFDIHCDLKVKVNQVILTGESVRALCSFYISGGRNVALKQKVAQSTILNANSEASNAVDGGTSNWFTSATCSHTDEGKREADWNVTFSQPASVTRYVIYNRDEGAHVDERLQGFELTSYDPAGTAVFRFTDTAPTEQVVYTVTSLATEVQTINIRAHKVDRYGQIILTLCEVEVYGDSVCEPGWFGRNCEHKCNCADSNETCFVSTGGCPSGFPSGFQGKSCSEVCRKGWFGASCQYKCHCQLDLCEPSDGSCTQGVSCTSGWFGPSCQYEDLVQSETLDQSLLPSFVVRDSNDNTCVDDGTEKVMVVWTIPYQFTWLRAVVIDPGALSRLFLQFETDSSQLINCTNHQQARVDDRTVDIHCDLSQVVKHVILTGEGVKYLCSVYISGGRNVALKQRTTQSSIYPLISMSQSGNAVDGNRDSLFEHGSCTHTNFNDNSPTWSVTFSRKLTVNRYVLYNRHIVAHRLQGFLLESFSEDGTNVFRFKDLVPTAQGVYTVTSTAPPFPISLVKIQIASVDVHQYANFLTLCEVEIFGDNLCEPGLYGRECEHKCACAHKNDTCFVSTGGCPSGCAPGFQGKSCSQVCRHGSHGPDCSSSCSQFCRTDGSNTSSCDHVHGACLHGCKPGYTGAMCYEECENGHYGQKCSATCPRMCLVNMASEQRVCHHVDGTCLQGCQPGYTGPLCVDTCSSGTHGQDCSSVCSPFCEVGNMSQPVCDHIDGTCLLGCQAGYLGSTCEELCDNGIYGPGCSLFCPEFCKVGDVNDTICHHANGTCLQGCQDGYIGPMCNQSTDIVTHGYNSSQCPEFCAAGVTSEFICHPIDGTCLHGCQPGYRGAKCDKYCVRGAFGKDCSSGCPQHCMKFLITEPVCHHISAVCLQGCMPGLRGVHCDESCDPGTYGNDCSLPCPHHCEMFDPTRPVCHRVSGACTQGCLHGFQGIRCEEKCANGFHGQDCTQDCPQHCEDIDRSQSACGPISGICLQGCKPGHKGIVCDEICDRETYGRDCSFTCPQHCGDTDINRSVCHHVTGACVQGCEPGYGGIRCSEKCSRRMFGQDCSYDCPQQCASFNRSQSICDHVSGFCTQGCKPGYEGILCDEECGRGTYGQNCNSTCPQYCQNVDINRPVCHHTSGACTQGCQPGYTGLLCDKPCTSGTFGENCLHSCPEFCDPNGQHASVCHHIEGVCLNGCQPRRRGDFCDQECENGYYGKHCNTSCPQLCAAEDPRQLVCNNINGSCLQGCQAGYHGLICDEPCDNGHYGKGCGQICPEFCAVLDIDKPVCHHVGGECLQGCKATYRGPHCSDDCEPDWFGSGCKYRCHCSVENTCWTINTCIVNGETRCYVGWFGPACQYVNLANSKTVLNPDRNIQILTDREDTTCLQSDTTEITMSWYQPYLLTWLRIVLKDAVIIVPEDFTNLFNVTFKHQNGTAYSCRNLQLARHSPTAIDIYCEAEMPVTHLTLTGPGVGDLCSLSVSGGRNVALREKTSQTSTMPAYSGKTSESYLAVDGNVRKLTESSKCTMTDNSDQRPRWYLTFSHPMTLNRFVIHTSYVDQGWILGFILTAFSLDDVGMFSYQDSSKKPRLIHTVIPPQEISATSGLSIEATKASTVIVRKYLGLCEVEVFGDSVCPHGLYGRDCENHCLCPHAEQSCFVSTGACPLQAH